MLTHSEKALIHLIVLHFACLCKERMRAVKIKVADILQVDKKTRRSGRLHKCSKIESMRQKGHVMQCNTSAHQGGLVRLPQQ